MFSVDRMHIVKVEGFLISDQTFRSASSFQTAATKRRPAERPNHGPNGINRQCRGKITPACSMRIWAECLGRAVTSTTCITSVPLGHNNLKRKVGA